MGKGKRQNNNNMNLNQKTLLVIMSLTVLLSFKNQEKSSQSFKKQKTNIIYILADDLGYGNLSITGQKMFSTPNIDKLAKDGILFTQHYSGSTVCAPSRSALMTG